MKKLMIYTLALLCATWLSGCSMNSASSNPKISIEKAKEIALQQANLNQNDIVKMDVEDTMFEELEAYEIDITTNAKEYEYHIDQQTGDILVTKVKERKLNTLNQNNKITKEKAEQLAFDHAKVKKETIQDLRTKTDFDDGVNVYVISFIDGEKDYEYKITKDHGQLLAFEVENLDYKKKANKTFSISLEEASTLALNKVKGATKQDLSIEADIDDGRAIFEGEIQYNNKEYEFEIDATTGSFIKWEEETNKLPKKAKISKEKASVIALSKVPGAQQKHVTISLDEEDGIAIYEGEIHYQGYEYEFEINASTGAMISWEKELEND